MEMEMGFVFVCLIMSKFVLLLTVVEMAIVPPYPIDHRHHRCALCG